MTEKQRPESSEISSDDRASFDAIVDACIVEPARIALLSAIATLPASAFNKFVSMLVNPQGRDERIDDDSNEALVALGQEAQKYYDRS